MTTFLGGVRSLVLLIVRVCLGGVLIARGFRRWQGSGLEWQTDYLRPFGVPYLEFAASGAIVLELVGGIFLIVGALTPLIAAAVVAEQVLIIAWTKWSRGLWLGGPAGDGWEYNLITACLGLVLLVFGAGAVAVDRLFRRPARERQDNFILDGDPA